MTIANGNDDNAQTSTTMTAPNVFPIIGIRPVSAIIPASPTAFIDTPKILDAISIAISANDAAMNAISTCPLT